MNDKQFLSEGAIFKYKLGEDWQTLNPAIQKRFDKNLAVGEEINYEGVMTQMQASIMGLVFANLMRPIGCLQPFTTKDTPVIIKLYSDEQGYLYKHRQYLRGNKKPFTFISRMKLNEHDEVLELVDYGFGMVLHVSVNEDKNLHFFSDHYFLKLGNYRIKIPLILTPGITNLTHYNINDENFHIRIDIKHPLFGQMFLHEGRFWEKGAIPLDDYLNIDFASDTGRHRRV